MDQRDHVVPVWGVLLALVVALAIACGLGSYLIPRKPNYPVREGVEPQGINYRAGGYKCQTERNAALAAGLKEFKESYRCEKNKEEARAQREEALYASRSLDVSKEAVRLSYNQSVIFVVQATVGVLTLFAAGMAALYAKKAAEETGSAAQTAKRQLDAVKIAERAYVVPYIDFPVANSEGSLHIVNVGRTHAHIVEVRYKVSTKLPARDRVIETVTDSIEPDIICSGGRHDCIARVSIDPSSLHFFGFIRYFDVYRKIRRSYFRYDFSGSAWKAAGGSKWNQTK